MGLTNAIVKAGATSAAVTGGTDETFGPDGVTVVNGLHIADTAQTDFRIRRGITIKNRQPLIDSLGVFSKDKKSITIVAPKLLASGKTQFNLIRIEREIHPESTAAEALDLNLLGVQVLSDADFLTFWATGSLL